MFRNYGDISRSAVNHDGPSKKRRFECDHCDAGWQSETDTFLHRENHAEEMKQWFKRRNHNVCLTCVKKFPRHSALMTHYKLRHLYSTGNAKRIERQIFVCEQCSQVFFNKNMLTAHIFKKHWIVGKDKASKMLFQCPTCDKDVTLPKLWQHLQKHTVMTISLCKICYTKYRDSEGLQIHLSSNHASYYYCDQCSKSEVNLKNFQQHIELHEEKISKLKFNWDTEEPKKRFLKHWTYPKWKIFDGVNLRGQIQVCILCRHICTNDLEKRHHAASHFITLKSTQQPTATSQVTEYKCTCGETFTSNILRKQHLFKYKEGHGAEDSSVAAEVDKTKDGDVVETEEITATNSNEIRTKIEELVTGDLLDRIFIGSTYNEYD